MDSQNKCPLVSDPIVKLLRGLPHNARQSQTLLTIFPRDNRITIHNASWDYEGSEPRHGTRVTSLAEKPYFDADAPTRREALGLADN
jgi:hypothetical protein